MSISEFAAGLCEADYDPRFAGYYDGAHPDPDEERPCLVAPPLGDVVADLKLQLQRLRLEWERAEAAHAGEIAELQRIEAVRSWQIAKLEAESAALRKDVNWDKLRVDNAERMIHKALNRHTVDDYGTEVS